MSFLGCSWWPGSLWLLADRAGYLAVTAFETACGTWLMLAPFVLHGRAASHVLVNHVAIGAMVLIVSLSEAWMLIRRPRRAR